jgi:hypothetical protein
LALISRLTLVFLLTGMAFPLNGRQSASIKRLRVVGLTGVPSFREVGMSVVNFTVLVFLCRRQG